LQLDVTPISWSFTRPLACNAGACSSLALAPHTRRSRVQPPICISTFSVMYGHIYCITYQSIQSVVSGYNALEVPQSAVRGCIQQPCPNHGTGTGTGTHHPYKNSRSPFSHRIPRNLRGRGVTRNEQLRGVGLNLKLLHNAPPTQSNRTTVWLVGT
jgi:hypothetical protein